MENKRKLLSPIKSPRKVKVGRSAGTTPRKRLPSSTAQESTKIKATVGYAARCIENYEYKKAFTSPYKNFAGARRALEALVKFIIRKKIRGLLKDDNCILLKTCTLENLKDFKWSDILQYLKKHVTILYAALVSTATTKDNEKSLVGSGGRQLTAGIGLSASLLIHSRSPQKANFVQGLNGIELWRCGAQRKILKHFNKLGISTSHSATLQNISKIRVHVDEDVLGMVTKLQTYMENGFPEPNEERQYSESDEDELEQNTTDSDSPQHSSLIDSSDDASPLLSESESFDITDEEMAEKEPENVSPGFCLVWDNVGKMVKASHQSTERQNKMMLWALTYCSENRIPTSHLSGNATIQATDINLEKFLPSSEDINGIKSRMETIVTMIIIEEIPFFSAYFNDCAKYHIRHRFWRESSKKSKLVNLGVRQENPSTIAGTIKILEHLHQYVPQPDQNVFGILCFGDGLSCERHNDVHMARSNGATKMDKLQGLQPQVQEFHKRMLLMQDLMDIFFSGSSATEKGTLFHLKNIFGHRSIKKDVGETFNHAADFIKFVTYGYVILACLQEIGFGHLDDELDMSKIDEKGPFMESLAHKIFDLFWHDPNQGDIINASLDIPPYTFCYCKEDTGAPMIHCSGVQCPGQNWFHLECIELSEEDIPDDDFFCSQECRRRKNYKYCCNVDLGTREPMIGCDNKDCEKGEWFHWKCKGIKIVPAGEWFCSKQCKEHAKKKGKANNDANEDGCFNYVRALTYMGLMDLVRKDAVRENDGEAMMSHWRLDLIQFHNRNHPKYVLLAHRLLAGVAGWLPQRLQMDSIWNRTVNLAGAPGRNIEGDLVNEFLNKEFTESLKDAGGNLTEETVFRHSQMVGSLGKVLDKAFLDSMDLEDRSFIKKTSVDMSQDLRTFVTCLGRENLLQKIPGREFKSFPNFSFTTTSSFPQRLKKKIKQLSKRLDTLRRCVE